MVARQPGAATRFPEKLFSQTNGHGRAMLAPTRVFRQPAGRACPAPTAQFFQTPAVSIPDTAGSVSYTHLDVYKRQLKKRAYQPAGRYALFLVCIVQRGSLALFQACLLYTSITGFSITPISHRTNTKTAAKFCMLSNPKHHLFHYVPTTPAARRPLSF